MEFLNKKNNETCFEKSNIKIRKVYNIILIIIVQLADYFGYFQHSYVINLYNIEKYF